MIPLALPRLSLRPSAPLFNASATAAPGWAALPLGRCSRNGLAPPPPNTVPPYASRLSIVPGVTRYRTRHLRMLPRRRLAPRPASECRLLVSERCRYQLQGPGRQWCLLSSTPHGMPTAVESRATCDSTAAAHVQYKVAGMPGHHWNRARHQSMREANRPSTGSCPWQIDVGAACRRCSAAT